MNRTLNLVAVNIGNSRTQIGVFVDGRIQNQERLANHELAGIVDRISRGWEAIGHQPRAAVVVASVDDSMTGRIVSAVEDQLSIEVYVIGVDLPVPITVQLDPETITGLDRLLNAVAAFDTLRQACIVVDAGTAVTVDFVDGQGTFHGGAIAPGVAMQLQSMHEHAAALPNIEFRTPEGDAFGRSTVEAMLRGVFHGVRGMVWRLVEHYAEAYGAYPVVIATGGDAEMLFGRDELIDRVVPELTLLGMVTAMQHALTADDADVRP